MHIDWVDVAPAGQPPVRLRVREWPGSNALAAGPDLNALAAGPDLNALAARPDLNALAAGPAAGRAFLLVHGLASNARLWDAVADRLAQAGHRVLAVDLRSHGESDAPAEGYDTTTAASDLAVVCASLGLGPVIAVGQSWGGNVVVRFAARHPGLVAAVGLVDGGWIDLTSSFDSWPECEAALRPPDIDGRPADELRRQLAAGHPDWSPEAVEATLANLRVRPDGTLERRLRVEDHMKIVRSMWDDPPGKDLSSVTAPAMLLPALPAADRPSRHPDKRELVARAAAALAQATVREYVGGDHDLHAQQPERVAHDLLDLAALADAADDEGGR